MQSLDILIRLYEILLNSALRRARIFRRAEIARCNSALYFVVCSLARSFEPFHSDQGELLRSPTRHRRRCLAERTLRYPTCNLYLFLRILFHPRVISCNKCFAVIERKIAHTQVFFLQRKIAASCK